MWFSPYPHFSVTHFEHGDGKGRRGTKIDPKGRLSGAQPSESLGSDLGHTEDLRGELRLHVRASLAWRTT